MAVLPGARVRVLDLRAVRAGEASALEETLTAAAQLVDLGVLELFAPAEPTVLIAALRGAGLVVAPAQHEGGFLVRAGKRALPPLDDLTRLEPPLPLERVLLALSQLERGAVFHALLPRDPVPLRGMLEARAVEYEVAMRPDGTALLWLTR